MILSDIVKYILYKCTLSGAKYNNNKIIIVIASCKNRPQMIFSQADHLRPIFAIRLASSNDSLADFNDETFAALQAKHPPPPTDTCIPPPPSPEAFSIQVLPNDVLTAIKSFPNCSSGGPDKLQPQHLKDMVLGLDDPLESPILSALTEFCSLVLQGNTPAESRPFFIGASLVAFRKKQWGGGGVRPIAVGCTLRRLVAKVASRKVACEMADLLSPWQLGSPGYLLITPW